MSNSAMKKIILVIFFIMGLNSVFAATNVIDVTITERGYENVLYNPLKATTGVYVDANENRSAYYINGTILIENNHPSEAVYDTVLNITGINNIYGLSFSAGRTSYLTTSGNSVIILIPDLGPGENSTLVYNVNTTNISPPLNFTSSYSNSRIFASLPVTVTDNVINNLNSVSYPNNCLYDITITQFAMELDDTVNVFNLTFDSTSMAGPDAGNAGFSADNRTINWNLWAGGCFYSGNTTSINYDLLTNENISVSEHYGIINTTITYSFNDTFSRIDLSSITSILDLDSSFNKYLETVLDNDNATWRINGTVINPSNITVNLTTVNFWVTVRDATGTGFTNPSAYDNDTVSGAQLNVTYLPGVLLNNTLAPWKSGNWLFNYTYSTSPIVWMDIENAIINDDGIQLTNRSVSYGQNYIYIKEIYIATGYWLQISKNITRLEADRYNVFIKVVNLGNAPTPPDQVVQVYNFLHNSFSLNSSMVTSVSPWYTTDNASEVLNDPIYNGTMYQFGIMPNGNPVNSSLDKYGGAQNVNNTWTLTYNVTGSGEFNFDDLFLTGLDPLHVQDYGSTQAVTVEGIYGFISSRVEVVFAVVATVVGVIALFF